MVLRKQTELLIILVNFAYFLLFFCEKCLFVQSSSEKYKFISMFVMILDNNMYIFLQNGDVQSQKLQNLHLPLKIAILKFFENIFVENPFPLHTEKFIF